MSIKTNELQLLTSIQGTDSILVDSAVGTGRLTLEQAAQFFATGNNAVSTALSNKVSVDTIGQAGGVATLGDDGLLAVHQQPYTMRTFGNKLLTQGWYRIYEGMSCSALVHVGSIYAAYPGQQLMLIASFDIRAPQITVLSSASAYTNGVFDEARMVWSTDKTTCYLDIHYRVTEGNMASTSALVAGVSNTHWKFIPHNFVLVDDVVDEGLIAVPEIAIHQTSSGELNPTETAAQTVALSLCEDVTPVEGAANSYSRSADGQVVVNVDVTADDTAASVCAANLPEGCRPTATISSGDITVQPDGKVMVSGSGAGSVCYYAAG